MTLGAIRHVVLPAGQIGGSALLVDELDGAAFDFTYTDIYEQARVKDSKAPLNNFRGDPARLLTYTSPSVKWTQRANGLLAPTNGTTDLPYEWDAAGNARGLCLEEARTNVCIQSQDLATTWANFDTTETVNTTTAPDGTSTADKLVESVNTSEHFIRAAPTITVAVNTWSVYAKAADRSWIALTAKDSADHYTFFNLTNGSVGTNAAGNTSSVVAVGNGWYRCIVTRSSDVTTGKHDIYLASADNTSSYTGDGSKGVYIWGAQVELGAFATTYIPTTTVPVTRAADNISLATTKFNHSATVGTLYARFRPRNVAAIRFAVVMDDGTANERFALGSSAAGAGSFSVIDGGVAQTAPLTSGTVAANATSEAAASWVAADFALSLNGGAVATDVAGTLPTVTSLKFGTAVSAASPLNGWLEHVVHLPRAMSDAELARRST